VSLTDESAFGIKEQEPLGGDLQQPVQHKAVKNGGVDYRRLIKGVPSPSTRSGNGSSTKSRSKNAEGGSGRICGALFDDAIC